MNLKTISMIRSFFLFLVLFFPAISPGPCLGDDLGKIRDQALEITSVYAKFVQKKHLDILEKPLVSNGIFYFKAPDFLRWQYTDPVASLLLMDSENIRQYVETDGKMEKRQDQGLKAMRVFFEQVCAWMQGGFDNDPAFEARLVSEKNVVLTPAGSSEAAIIEKIELVFADTSGVIESATIYEDSASYTRIEFHETKINPEIDDRIFHPEQLWEIP